ncbi:MAG: hypothetical protein GY757_43915, partial [bacterium]|nr:hypothetical protein [bacterium]
EGIITLLKNRLCGSDAESIILHCIKRKSRDKGIQRVFCKKKFKWIRVRIIENPKGGASGTNVIVADPDDVAKDSADEYEQTVFHEILHLSEHFYENEEFKEITPKNEDYSYTCTKRFYENKECTGGKKYPKPNECPGGSTSECLDCQTYHNPRDPNRK